MKPEHKIICGLFIGIVLLIAFAGCLSSVSEKGTLSPASTSKCDIRDLGNGVLFFECNDANFGEALSQYIGSHNVTVTSTAQVDQQMVTTKNTLGYYVTVKEGR